MPTYTYEREDGSRFDIVQKITEEPLEACPETGQKVKRVITGGNFILKGGGWYKDGYSGSGSGSSTSSSSPSPASDSSSSSSSETKSAASCTGSPASCGCSSGGSESK